MAHGTLQLVKPTRDCLLCGSRLISEDEYKRTLEVVTAIGLDVNFGDPVEICQGCVGVMADLIGRVDPEVHDRLSKAYDTLVDQHDELSTKYNEQKERIDKILQGKKAQKTQLQEA